MSFSGISRLGFLLPPWLFEPESGPNFVLNDSLKFARRLQRLFQVVPGDQVNLQAVFTVQQAAPAETRHTP